MIALTLAVDMAAAAVLGACGLRPLRSPDQECRTRHAVYHHDLRPNVACDGVRWGSRRYSIHTNSLGFRDGAVRDVPLEPAGEVRRRVVLIGDSLTEGVGVAFEQTVAGILQQQFAARGMEVLNAAVVSYAPIIYDRKVRHLVERIGLRFHHLVVLLDISDIQDEADYYSDDGGGGIRDRHNPISEAWRTFVRDHTIAINCIGQVLHRLRKGDETVMALDKSLNLWRSLWTVEPAAFASYGERGLSRAAAHLGRLRAFLRERGLGMTLAVYPWPDQIMRNDRDSLQVSHWRTWCAENDVRFVNCFPRFFAGGAAAADVVRDYFIAGDVHWNERGHALIAGELAADLEHAVLRQ